MLALVALFVIVVPMVEIYVIIQVSHAIGGLDTFGLLILSSIVGIWLAKHEGFIVLRKMQAQLHAGHVPANELVDGVLVLIAGVLLIPPGFVTDAIGLLLLFPPTRGVVRRSLRRRFEIRTFGDRGPGANGNGIIDV